MVVKSQLLPGLRGICNIVSRKCKQKSVSILTVVQKWTSGEGGSRYTISRRAVWAKSWPTERQTWGMEMHCHWGWRRSRNWSPRLRRLHSGNQQEIGAAARWLGCTVWHPWAANTTGQEEVNEEQLQGPSHHFPECARKPPMGFRPKDGLCVFFRSSLRLRPV